MKAIGWDPISPGTPPLSRVLQRRDGRPSRARANTRSVSRAMVQYAQRSRSYCFHGCAAQARASL
eukprot:507630-Lingulodinium_polyedra.AAC.1